MIPSGSSISFRIPAQLNNICLLGISARALFSSLGFAKTDAFHLELAVVEAANNIVLHAYRQEENKALSMDFSVSADRVTCTFTDQGKAADFLREHAPMRCGNDIQLLPENKRGLTLLHEIMDEVRYMRKNENNILTLVKYL